MAKGLLGKIGKAARVAVLGSALLGALDDANAQVKIYMRVRDVETKEETQVLKKRKSYWLEIMGDNTELKDANGNYLKTTKFGWHNVTIPSQQILYLGAETPNPKYGDDDFFRKDPNYPVDIYRMGSNVVRLDYGSKKQIPIILFVPPYNVGSVNAPPVIKF